MQTRTYSEKSNARRAARAAGLDPDTAVKLCDEGFEVTFPDHGTTTVAAKPEEPLDGIPEFCKIPQEERNASWITNPPQRSVAAQLKEITMPKAKAKPEKKDRGATGSEKNATLLKMLKTGATVDQLTTALEWLPHTLRARISRLAKPKSKGGEGLKIERTREDKVTSYRIAS